MPLEDARIMAEFEAGGEPVDPVNLLVQLCANRAGKTELPIQVGLLAADVQFYGEAGISFR